MKKQSVKNVFVATTPQTAFRSFLYGGASMLLALDVFFLIRAALTANAVPIVPLLAGVLTASGLLLIIFAEHHAREQDKRSHRDISRVAHQLVAPLRNLEENLDQLIQKADTLPAEQRLKLKGMETKTKILLDNVRDVFLMLQAHSGRISQDVRMYDVCALVTEACTRARPLASARNVELITTLHCEKAPVRADRRLFLIALGHILENAIAYTVTPGLVNVAVTKGNSQVRIIVQDRGVGISGQAKAMLWQPFARGDKAEQYDPDGIGVGVVLAHHIIREVGGTLIIRTREHAAGTEVEITLPLVGSA